MKIRAFTLIELRKGFSIFESRFSNNQTIAAASLWGGSVQSKIGNPKSKIHHASRGFTLIELLTVIAIIGILAAIIIPTVGRVRQTARTAACLSNLRQFGVASAMYQHENHGRLNYQPGTTTPEKWGFWQERFAPYISFDTVRNAQTVWICPAATTRKLDRTDSDRKDYAMSSRVCLGSAPDFSGLALSEFDTPSRKAYIVDVDVSEKNTTLIEPSKFFAFTPGGDGKLALRHGGKVNILFLDGHVQTFGSPPIPAKLDVATGEKWLSHDKPPPDI